MTKEELERYLTEGLSLEQIGEQIGRHPSTVSYHLKKHGLAANGHEFHTPNGKVDPVRLRELIDQGSTVRQAAGELGVSGSTVRHWLKRLGLKTQTLRRRQGDREARGSGLYGIQRVCPKHGKTIFVARSEGGFRRGKCRIAAVGRWRRRVKERLVLRAGGACQLCGYHRYFGALQFHHLEPSEKEFSISRNGTTRSYAEVCAEADKCALLCANCHVEVEAGFVKLPESSAPLRLLAT